MKVSVRTLTGVEFALDFDDASSITVAALKSRLEKKMGLPASSISLVFRGRHLCEPSIEKLALFRRFSGLGKTSDPFVVVYNKSKLKNQTGIKRKSAPATIGRAPAIKKPHNRIQTRERRRLAPPADSPASSSSRDAGGSAPSASSQMSQLLEMREFLRSFGSSRQPPSVDPLRSSSRRRSQPSGPPSSSSQLEAKEAHITTLEGMGFSRAAATRSLLFNRNNLEVSLNWLLEHASDPGINDSVTPAERTLLSRRTRGSSAIEAAFSDFFDIPFPFESSSVGGSNEANDSEPSARSQPLSLARANSNSSANTNGTHAGQSGSAATRASPTAVPGDGVAASASEPGDSDSHEVSIREG